ncbi:hypothetical protein BMUNKI379_11525 [Burkholderia multivorans]|nr:hypothetical protein BMUNKI379_11525 [Burkholderia multivorans]
MRIALQQSGGLSIYELCDVLETHKSTVLKTIARHRSELHVVRWIPTTRRPKAIWALGTRMDAPKPVAVRVRKQSNPFAQMAAQLSASETRAELC